MPWETWKREASRSGGRVDEPEESLLVPIDEILFRRLALDRFPAAFGLFLVQLEILDDVFRGLRHHPAAVIKPFAPGAPGDLVEIARAENRGFLAVEFAEAGKKDGADGHVDAGAQRVRAADDFQQAPLRQLLHQDAVFGQNAGVMQADAVLEPAPDVRPVRTGELEILPARCPGRLFPRACRH